MSDREEDGGEGERKQESTGVRNGREGEGKEGDISSPASSLNPLPGQSPWPGPSSTPSHDKPQPEPAARHL